jgi:hypothetical protein
VREAIARLVPPKPLGSAVVCVVAIKQVGLVPLSGGCSGGLERAQSQWAKSHEVEAGWCVGGK